MKNKTKRMTVAVMLAAIGIIIPLIMPRIVIGHASYTLGSHIPLFIAIFIGPDVATFVGIAIGTGFFLSTTPIIAARAFSHVIWAVPAAFFFRRHHDTLIKPKNSLIFNFIIGVIHAIIECLVVVMFFMVSPDEMPLLLMGIIIPIGLGGLAHSMIDYFFAGMVYKQLLLRTDLLTN